MENWIFTTLPTLGKVALSILAIFTVMIVITRISGLRTFAKMSSFDFASTIAIGSVLAAVVLNTDQSLLKGGLALAGIVIFQSAFSFIIRKSDVVSKLLTNKPLLLMEDGKILYPNLQSANLGEEDLIAKLREANVFDFDEVCAVVLESTGDISVLHTKNNKKLNKKLLQGVRTV